MSIIIGSVPVHMDAHAPSYHVKKHNKTRCFEYTGDFPLQSLGPLGVIWETIWFILKSLFVSFKQSGGHLGTSGNYVGAYCVFLTCMRVHMDEQLTLGREVLTTSPDDISSVLGKIIMRQQAITMEKGIGSFACTSHQNMLMNHIGECKQHSDR